MLTRLKDELIKIGAKVASHGRPVAFRIARAAIPQSLFADFQRRVAEPPLPPVASSAQGIQIVMRSLKFTGQVRRDEGGRSQLHVMSGYRQPSPPTGSCRTDLIAPEFLPITRGAAVSDRKRARALP